ncbi:MAG TPA: hypothetical protein VHE13_03410, partial [Opitutus sp.]|nr:hypothetical protein [Opitutus sp.]
AGYHVSSAPAENRDGVSARLKKEEEIWIEWFTGDALSVSAVAIPSEKLRKEVSQVLSGTKIKEARIV